MAEKNISVKQIVCEAAGQNNIKVVDLNIQYSYFKARPTSLKCSSSNKVRDVIKEWREFLYEEFSEHRKRSKGVCNDR